MLYAGWDKTHGFQLYQSDPSGNYNGWKATCIGANNQSATSLMKQEYKEEVIPLSQALQLAIKVLTKTCDATTLTPDKFDLATLTVVDGKVVYHEYIAAASQGLLDVVKAEEASADAQRAPGRNWSVLRVALHTSGRGTVGCDADATITATS